MIFNLLKARMYGNTIALEMLFCEVIDDRKIIDDGRLSDGSISTMWIRFIPRKFSICYWRCHLNSFVLVLT